MKECKIKKHFMSGDFMFQYNETAFFEDDSAKALEDAGLLEIVGEADVEADGKPKRGGKK